MRTPLVFDDPAYPETVVDTKGNLGYINYGGIDACAAFRVSMMELGGRYESDLTGN